MTRIAYLSRNDGTDMRIAKECRTLSEAGAQVVFIGWDRGQSAGAPDQLPPTVQRRVYRRGTAGTSARSAPGFFWHAIREVRACRPHAIHCVNEELLFVGALARLGLRRCRLVGDLFDSQLLRRSVGWRHGPTRLVARLAQASADSIIVTDEARLNRLPSVSRSKAVVVPNYPVDPGEDYAMDTPNSQRPRVLVAGSLSAGRGLSEILQATRRIPGASIVAAGWLYDDVARAFVDAPEVEYHGVVSAEEALGLASGCHVIFAHYAPTNANNRLASPNKVYDALAVGRPLLINSEVELSSWVVANDAGGAVAYGDIDGLAVDIERLTEPVAWERRRTRMRKLFEAGYSWDAASAELIQAHRLRPLELGDSDDGSPAISFVTTMYGGSGVGGHTFVQHLRSAALRGQLDIDFFATDTATEPGVHHISPGALATRLPGKWLTLSWRIRRELAQAAGRRDSAVWFNNSLLAAASCLARPGTDKTTPFIGMINDYENAVATWRSNRSLVRKLWHLAERFCARRLDIVVVNSEWMQRYICNAYGLHPDKVPVLYKAVDHTKLGVTETAEAVSGTRNIGYLKWDAERGGLAGLIRALAVLPDSHRLLAAGPDAKALTPYRKLAEELGVADRLELLGTLPREEIGPFLRRLDLFANPARDEALGVSLLEAMAVGTPVLAREVGGIPEVLDSGRAGLLFSGDDLDLADAIRQVFADERATERRRHHARTYVGRFSPEAMADTMNEISRVALGLAGPVQV